mmetsp:Transcript_76435/g.216102  ORF Transcript_76435/g.216102 Transcript_76435/m.216102 type:complete len:286 (+) Transcript_76435:122-979(+)
MISRSAIGLSCVETISVSAVKRGSTFSSAVSASSRTLHLSQFRSTEWSMDSRSATRSPSTSAAEVPGEAAPFVASSKARMRSASSAPRPGSGRALLGPASGLRRKYIQCGVCWPCLNVSALTPWHLCPCSHTMNDIKRTWKSPCWTTASLWHSKKAATRERRAQSWVRWQVSSLSSTPGSPPCSSRLTSSAPPKSWPPPAAVARARMGAAAAWHCSGPGTCRVRFRQKAVRPGCHRPSSSENITQALSACGTKSSNLRRCSPCVKAVGCSTVMTLHLTARTGPSM